MLGMAVSRRDNEVEETILIEIPAIYDLKASGRGYVKVTSSVQEFAIPEFLEGVFPPDCIRLYRGKAGKAECKKLEIKEWVSPTGIVLAGKWHND
jgi:hypothetical protein